VTILVLLGSPIPWPHDFPELLFPTKLVHAHAAQILNSRVLTTDQWADYLIYTNPQQKVFADGRSDFYGPEIGNAYLGLRGGQADWQQVMDRYGFNLALLPSDDAIVQLLKQSPNWKVADIDDKRILLVRDSSPVPLTGNIRP
jgi:hypothetical protein